MKKNSNLLILALMMELLNFFCKKKKRSFFVWHDPSSDKFAVYYNKRINLIPDYFSKKKLDIYSPK